MAVEYTDGLSILDEMRARVRADMAADKAAGLGLYAPSPLLDLVSPINDAETPGPESSISMNDIVEMMRRLEEAKPTLIVHPARKDEVMQALRDIGAEHMANVCESRHVPDAETYVIQRPHLIEPFG